eukprot:1476511-Prymnesium_polylepis.1
MWREIASSCDLDLDSLLETVEGDSESAMAFRPRFSARLEPTSAVVATAVEEKPEPWQEHRIEGEA